MVRGIEAACSNVTNSTCLVDLAVDLELRAERVTVVLNKPEPVLLAEGLDKCKVKGVAEGVSVIAPLDLAKISKLTFDRPDREAFPLLDLALYSLSRGGATCAVLNAANEVAVAAYLSGQIKFGQISNCVCHTVYAMPEAEVLHTLEGIFEADKKARRIASDYLNI